MPEPTRITFVTWDADTDGVAVLHDGEQVWQESSFDSLDQYLRHHAPIGQPVVIDHLVRDGADPVNRPGITDAAEGPS